MATSIGQPLDQLFDQHRAGQTAVAADRNLWLALGNALGTDGAANPISRFSMQGFADHAANVIGAEDALGQCGYQVGHVIHLGKLH